MAGKQIRTLTTMVTAAATRRKKTLLATPRRKGFPSVPRRAEHLKVLDLISVETILVGLGLGKTLLTQKV